MAKVKQAVKSFLEMMQEVDENSWEAFLAKEEERIGKKFFPVGKTLGEESRLVSYLNFLYKNSAVRPKIQNSYKFFEVWRRTSGYMPFEGRSGAMPGVKASVEHVNQGIQVFLSHFGIDFVPSMTQADWDTDEQYHHRKVFGTNSVVAADEIPF